jgi:hypothetical protein
LKRQDSSGRRLAAFSQAAIGRASRISVEGLVDHDRTFTFDLSVEEGSDRKLHVGSSQFDPSAGGAKEDPAQDLNGGACESALSLYASRSRPEY